MSRLYQLKIQGGAGQPLSAAAQQFSGSIGAQSWSETAPLSISAPLSVSTFTDQSARTRHIRATFTVTNNSGSVLTDLMFLPVDTNDTDNDLTNNAALPTVGNTPFRDVKYYDGSDASVKAGLLTPAQGKVFNVGAGITELDPLANAFSTGLSSAGLQVVPPPGLTTTVKDYGWKVAPTLAPGQSANITFAFDLHNIDPNTPEADPYSFSLIFASAQEQRSASLIGDLLEGHVTGGTYPSAATYLVNASEESRVNAGTITNGNFLSMKLQGAPTGNTLFPLTPSGGSCSFRGSQSANPNIAFYQGVNVYTPHQERLGAVQQTITQGGSLNDSVVARVYSTGPVTVKGQITCNSPADFVLNYDMTLQSGWNAVEYTKVGNTNTMMALQPQVKTELTAFPEEPYLYIALNPSHLQFDADGTATAQATFYQHGGYNGPIRLVTGSKDLSVTPSTLTLPALTAQNASKAEHGWSGSGLGLSALGLSAQKVDTTLTFKYTGSGAQNLNFYLSAENASGRSVGYGQGTLTAQNPSVLAAFKDLNGREVFVCQGETLDLNVQVNSLYGFAGQTTVTLAGLPAGVTVPSVPVTLVAGGTATIVVPVTVAPNAALTMPKPQVTLTSPDLAATNEAPSIEFGVCPARTLLGKETEISQQHPIPAGEDGVWIYLGYNAQHDPAKGSYPFLYKLFRPSGEVLTASAPQSLLSGVSLPNGDLLVPSGNSDDKVYRVTPSGGVASLAAPSYRSFSSAAADYLGRVWYATFNGELHRWNPETGEDITVDTSYQYSHEYGKLTASPDRKSVLYRPSSTFEPFRVIQPDTGIVTVRTIANNSRPWGNTAAISNTGVIWIGEGDSYSYAISRLNHDGTVTIFQHSNIVFRGIDQADGEKIWVQKGTELALLNVDGQVIRSFPMGIGDATPLKSGGVGVISVDYALPRQTYVTFLLK